MKKGRLRLGQTCYIVIYHITSNSLVALLRQNNRRHFRKGNKQYPASDFTLGFSSSKTGTLRLGFNPLNSSFLVNKKHSNCVFASRKAIIKNIILQIYSEADEYYLDPSLVVTHLWLECRVIIGFHFGTRCEI